MKRNHSRRIARRSKPASAKVRSARAPTPAMRLQPVPTTPMKRSLVAIFSKEIKTDLTPDVRRAKNATTEVVVVGSRRGGFERKTRGPGGARFIPLAPHEGHHEAVNAAAKMAARNGFGRLVFVDLAESPGPTAVQQLDKALSSRSTFDIIASVAVAADPHTSQYRSTKGATLGFVPLSNRMTTGDDVRMSTFIAGPRAIGALAKTNLAGKATIGNQLVALAATQRLRIGEVSLRTPPTATPVVSATNGAGRPSWPTAAGPRSAPRDGLLSRVLETLVLRHPLLALGLPGAVALCLGLYLAVTVFLATQGAGAFPSGPAWAATTSISVGLILLFFAIIVNLLVAIRNRLA